MKRSEVNEIIKSGDAFIRSFGFTLPPFAYWSPDDFRGRAEKAPRVAEAQLGWDVTDFGLGRFNQLGLLLFTLRNGHAEDLAQGGGMVYAEKLMILRRDQVCVMHRHMVKAEDIINRGGGVLAMQLYASDASGKLDETADVEVMSDGELKHLPAGGELRLAPGESVTLLPGIWHSFWAEQGDVLAGEVSTVNDDLTDNAFKDPIGRFADIEEDEPPVHLLVSDYDTYLKDDAKAAGTG